MSNLPVVKENLTVPQESGELDNFLQSPLVKNYVKSVLPKIIKSERFLGVFLKTPPLEGEMVLKVKLTN